MIKDSQKFKIRKSILMKAMWLYNYHYPLKEIVSIEKEDECIYKINGIKVNVVHMI